MQKNVIILVLGLLLMNAVRAANIDSLRVYLKKSGRVVDNKDSADYLRVITMPDTSIDRDLYRVYDYYPNGKLKMLGTSLTENVNLVLDGVCIDFFMNGKRKSIT
jgi:hypothetical protein